MKKGDVINGYVLLQDFTNAGGGQCQWAFAEKDKRQYFIKEFLKPTYPRDGAPGSPEINEKRREKCRAFEQHHKALRKAISDACAAGGNLIYTIDFFRFGSRYYKITEKIDVVGLKIEDICKLPLPKKMMILKTAVSSLAILHQHDIVHGDLKPDNILIKLSETGNFIAKLIDFDNSYFSGKPPTNPDEVVGQMMYYSPELARYVQKDKELPPSNLQPASDIFALGLIYCQYLTGKLPSFDPKYGYPCVAVNNRQKLSIDGAGLSTSLVDLIEKMLDKKISNRPNTSNLLPLLKEIEKNVDIRSTEAPTLKIKSPHSSSDKGDKLPSEPILKIKRKGDK